MTRAQSSLAPEGTTAAARPAGARGALSPLDAELIDQWGASLRAAGWSPSSVERAEQRVRALARRTPAGLLRASSWDVAQLAEGRARARGCEFAVLLRTESWAKTARALVAFCGWAEDRGLVDPRQNPVRGMRRLPPAPGPAVVSARLARHYDALLHDPGLSTRDRALLLVLAHGLAPAEVVRLRVEHVDAGARLLWVVGHRRRARALPLSEYAVGILGVWAAQQAGREWLFDRPPRIHNGLLRLGRAAISTSLVREVVRQAAARVFPLASQRGIRRRLRPGGFADVFHTRLLSSRLPLHVVVELLGVDRVSHLRRYTRRPVTLARIHREWRRLTARRRWI